MNLFTIALSALTTLPLVPGDSLMVNVPNFGYSRYETVSFCLKDAGVDKYQDLQTDSHWETFEGCMVENT